jgi:hypothetical protein
MHSSLAPVVIIIFNRPDLTAQVFEVIRQAKPKKLLVIADGPRNKLEEILCQKTRAVTEVVDWDCEILRNYAEENLGCRKRISSGLDWVFEQVEEAIILEDDCLPSLDFFLFCQELLDYYRNDTRIWSICGHNFQDGQWRGDGSYYFSHYPDPWGWATWKRSWQHYDRDLNDWNNFHNRHLFEEVFDNPLETEHWNQILNLLHNENKPDTWDYQWIFTCLKNNALSIWPNVNLVSNIGFREDGTNCQQESNWSNMDTKEIGEIKHPQFILRDKSADLYYFYHRQNGLYRIEQRKWHRRLRSQLGKLRRKLVSSHKE